jgi:putative peptide zinc metalloprotease protein
MRARRHILGLLVAALVACAAGPATATAQTTNAAVAVNTTDGSSIFQLAFDVQRVVGGVVDQQNVAIAYASCTSCQTVAISIQILLVIGNATTVTPENVAIAVNQACTLCQTLAAAYQFVVGYGTDITFTRQGWRRLRAIHRQLLALGGTGLSIDQIQARLTALMDELRQVLATQLVPRRRDWGEYGGQQGPQDQNGPPDLQSTQPAPGPDSSATTPTTTPDNGQTPTTETTPGTNTTTTTTPSEPSPSSTPTTTTTTP